jgi:hypothetical protein
MAQLHKGTGGLLQQPAAAARPARGSLQVRAAAQDVPPGLCVGRASTRIVLAGVCMERWLFAAPLLILLHLCAFVQA